MEIKRNTAVVITEKEIDSFIQVGQSIILMCEKLSPSEILPSCCGDCPFKHICNLTTKDDVIEYLRKLVTDKVDIYIGEG